MHCPFDRLDASSRDYLRRIWQTRGQDDHGIFVLQQRPFLRGVGQWFLLAGIALGIVVLITRPSPYSLFLLGVQVGLAGLAGLFLVLGLLALLRYCRRPGPIGGFTYVDALHIWEIRAGTVKVTPIENALAVEGQHQLADQTYAFTIVRVNLPDGMTSLCLNNATLGEQLHRFLEALIVLRRTGGHWEEDSGQRVPADGVTLLNPERLGALALRIARGETPVEPESLDLSRPIPVPTLADEADWPRRSWLEIVSPLLGASVAAAAGWLICVRVNDDLRFQDARDHSRRRHSPSELRDYLADTRNTRHRQEAQTLIGAYYDEAIARVKKLSEGEKVDPNLAGGFLALLDALKTADRPVITVGFRSLEEPVPVGEDQKALEKAVYELRMKETKELEDSARRSPDNTAILSSGRTFDKEQSRRREEVILKHLRGAMKDVLAANLLTLEPAEPGQQAMLEIAYHTYPSGSLYLFTDSDEKGPRQAATAKVKGLLRGYRSEWIITLRPPGRGDSWICELASSSAAQLNYEMEKDDPDWAPYAIILYSSFDNMASRLVAGFGLPESPQRQTFTFAEAVGKK